MFKLNTNEFKSLVKSVYLGGIIKECVIDIQDGVGLIQTIDEMNCMFISAKANVGDKKNLKNIKLNICDLAILVKFLDSIEKDKKPATYTISDDAKWLNIKIPGKGKVKLLLAQSEEEIATYVPDIKVAGKMINDCNHNIELTNDTKINILYFLKLFSSKSVLFSCKNNYLSIESNASDINKFLVDIGKLEGSIDFETEINGEYLLTILNYISEEKIDIYLGVDKPIILKQNDTIWALSPLQE